MKLRTVVLLLIAIVLYAGTTYTTTTSHRFWVGTLGTSSASVVGGTVYVRQIALINDSSSDVTGNGTCGDGTLLMPSSITVTAKSVYLIGYDDQVCSGGINLWASDGTNVTARVHYRTSLATP